MKKLFALFLLTLSVNLLAAQDKMVRLTRFEGSEITGVIAASAFKVEIIQDENTRAEVEIPAEVESKLEFNLAADGSVNLGIKGFSLKKNQQLSAKIYVKELKTVRARGASQITLATPMKVNGLVIELGGSSSLQCGEIAARDRVVAECLGSSEIEGTIDTRLLRVNLGGASEARLTTKADDAVWELSGASEATLKGEASTAAITAKSASTVDAKQYVIGTATLTAASASGISAGKMTELSATAGSASKIRYEGTPKITKMDTSGASSIQNY